jgi:hypothetical protein
MKPQYAAWVHKYERSTPLSGKRKVGQCSNSDYKKDLYETFECVDDKRTVYYCSKSCDNKVGRERFWDSILHPDDMSVRCMNLMLLVLLSPILCPVFWVQDVLNKGKEKVKSMFCK